MIRKKSRLLQVALGVALGISLMFGGTGKMAAFADDEVLAAPTEGWGQKVLDFSDAGMISEIGWMYYFYNGGFLYGSDAAYLEVAKGMGYEGGNALHAVRKAGAPSEFVMYSYHVPVTEGKTYNITAKVKTEGDNITFGMTRNEKDATGTTETYPGYFAEYSVSGTGGEWVDVSYNFTAASGTMSAGVKMMFNGGVGDVYIDKIQLREITTVGDEPPHNVWRLYGWGTGVNDCGVAGSTGDAQWWNQMTEASVSDESSDGDGASLELGGGSSAKTVFGALPNRSADTTYTLAFKYKGGADGAQIQIRMDGYTVDNAEFFWITGAGQAENVAVSGKAEEWTDFSYTFKVTNGTAAKETVFATLVASGGDYLVDEVSITCNDEDDPMQYVQNGSFSGLIQMPEGISMEYTTSVAEQPDGSYVYTAGNQAPRGVGTAASTESPGTVGYNRGVIKLDVSDLPEQQYKVSYEYRGGIWITTSLEVGVYPTNRQIWSSNNSGRTAEANNRWTTYESDLLYLVDTDGNPVDVVCIYGDATNTDVGATQTYFRNIKLTGEDGTVYEFGEPTVFDPEKGEESVYGENIYLYGEFDDPELFPATEWELTDGVAVEGFTHDDGNPQYRLAFRGKGKAVSPEIPISAAAADTFAKVLFVYENQGAELSVTLQTNDGTVLTALSAPTTENMYGEDATVAGQYIIPEGTTSLRIVIENTTDRYASVSRINAAGGGFLLETHVHTFVSDDDAEHPAKEEDATCQHGGSVSRYCSGCGEYIALESTPATDHVWGEWTIIEAPTCENSGRQERKCIYCEERDIGFVDPLGHDYENGVCTRCGAIDPAADDPDSSDSSVSGGDGSSVVGDASGGEGSGGCGSAVMGTGAALTLTGLVSAVFVRRRKDRR